MEKSISPRNQSLDFLPKSSNGGGKVVLSLSILIRESIIDPPAQKY